MSENPKRSCERCSVPGSSNSLKVCYGCSRMISFNSIRCQARRRSSHIRYATDQDFHSEINFAIPELCTMFVRAIATRSNNKFLVCRNECEFFSGGVFTLGKACSYRHIISTSTFGTVKGADSKWY